MSGFTENTAHGASEQPDRRAGQINLATAQRMLPLVRQIVTDLMQHGRRLAELQPEQDRLDRQRRTLAWPERARRYALQDELTTATKDVQRAAAELEALGVVLLDAETGRIGFPTVVNDQQAFFSWRAGEDALHYWHFAGETLRRVIPPTWFKASDIRLVGKR
jgi:hypothetical protein